MPVYVLHHNDHDGYGAKYAAWRFFGDRATYIEVNYHQPFPDIPLNKETEIYILDFSYRRDILIDVERQVKKLVVLDHHTTAEADLEGLDFAYFDMSKSGATMTWKLFFPMRNVPQFLLHVEDYDLWLFKLPETKAVLAGFSAIEGSLKNLDLWTKACSSSFFLTQCEVNGKAILADRKARIEYAFDSNNKRVKVVLKDNLRVGFYNTTDLISDMGHAVCLSDIYQADYSMSFYFMNNNEVKFDFRSESSKGVDVGKIAKQYGGGGRQTTAGAILPLEEALKVLNEFYQAPSAL